MGKVEDSKWFNVAEGRWRLDKAEARGSGGGGQVAADGGRELEDARAVQGALRNARRWKASLEAEGGLVLQTFAI